MIYTLDVLQDYTRDELATLLKSERDMIEWHSCPTPNTAAGRKRAKLDAAERARIEMNVTLIQGMINVR